MQYSHLFTKMDEKTIHTDSHGPIIAGIDIGTSNDEGTFGEQLFRVGVYRAELDRKTKSGKEFYKRKSGVPNQPTRTYEVIKLDEGCETENTLVEHIKNVDPKELKRIYDTIDSIDTAISAIDNIRTLREAAKAY